MEPKKTSGKSIIILLLLFIITLSGGMVLGATVQSNKTQAAVAAANPQNNGSSHDRKPKAEASKVDLNYQRIDTKMKLLQEIINEYYLFDADQEKIETNIYKGIMYGLEDPYSVYYTKEEYQQLMESTQGEYCGIGVMVSQDRTTGVITVIKAFKGTPGYEAGMQPGDILYKIGDIEVTGIDLDLVVSQYIKGEEDTPVNITVLRSDTNEYKEMTMLRKQIEVPTIESKMMGNDIGYIQVMEFDSVTAEQFKSAITTLQSQGMKKLIVDLRDNPGGVLDGVVDMLAYILPEGKIIYTADKNGEGSMYKSENSQLILTEYPETKDGEKVVIAEDNHELKIPMAVLVNENSASASEVFTGALKDYKWATIVGTTTFGKGIVQNIIPLSDGTALKLTVSHYYTPNGFDLHGKGIEPDITVELNAELETKSEIKPEEDNQLQAAIQVLNKK